MKRAHASSTDSLLMDDEGDEDCSLAEVKEAVEHISSHFRLPLSEGSVICCPPRSSRRSC